MPTIQGSLLTEQALTAIVDNRPIVVARDHPNFQPAVQALASNDAAALLAAASPASAMRAWGGAHDKFRVEGGTILYDGQPLPDVLTREAMLMLRHGYPAEPLFKFIDKLGLNPRPESREELLGFIRVNSMLLTPDGDLLAYKGVTGDFKDTHTRSIDNSIGTAHRMPREEVDDRRGVTCSRGFHVSSQAYAKGYGDRLVLVKVDPRDVVSVPADYREQKMRVCAYEVVAELPKRDTTVAPPEVKVLDPQRPTRAEVTKAVYDTFSTLNFGGGMTLLQALRQQSGNPTATLEQAGEDIELSELRLAPEQLREVEQKLQRRFPQAGTTKLEPHDTFEEIIDMVLDQLEIDDDGADEWDDYDAALDDIFDFDAD